MDKKLTFKIKREGGKMVDPHWRECETENTQCPLCRTKFGVVLGNKGVLYAFCTKCDKYFVGEE